MIRPLALAALAYAAASLLAVAVWAVVAPALARDEDAHDEDCTGPCCDPGPDDLMDLAEAVGVVPAVPDVEALALAALIDRCIDRLTEGETCPDYPDEIKWGAL